MISMTVDFGQSLIYVYLFHYFEKKQQEMVDAEITRQVLGQANFAALEVFSNLQGERTM